MDSRSLGHYRYPDLYRPGYQPQHENRLGIRYLLPAFPGLYRQQCALLCADKRRHEPPRSGDVVSVLAFCIKRYCRLSGCGRSAVDGGILWSGQSGQRLSIWRHRTVLCGHGDFFTVLLVGERTRTVVAGRQIYPA
ncbi:hypothetical protein D3C81_1889450 [compost metagenome]